ncbi:MAG: hypothetical protein J6X70_09700 [Muribaculaceae bacterium]|nr:hypothetical protein [Muribaculaceae bacterium]
MKKSISLLLVLFSGVVCFAQYSLPQVPVVPGTPIETSIPQDSIFIVTHQDLMLGNAAFAHCFIPCDTDCDGIVTHAEAAATTELRLGYGGRKNIIGSYDFLKYFPNLVHLDVGNTPLEEIDLSRNPKLEDVDLRLAIRCKRIKITQGCNPRIVYPNMEGDFTVTIVPQTPIEPIEQ